MCTLKNETSYPQLYELLVKNVLKRDTDIDLVNFYNHIKMYFNEVTRLQEDIIPAC